MTERKKLYNKIHKIIRDKVIKEYGNRCFVCGRSDITIQGGHVIPAGSSLNCRFMLEPINILPQCKNCNGLHRFNQAPYFKKYIEVFGVDQFNELEKQSRIIKQYKISELRELLKEVKNEQ